jgi:hypothetical protein
MGRYLLKFRSKSIGYPFAGKSDVGGSAVLQAESVFSLAEGVLWPGKSFQERIVIHISGREENVRNQQTFLNTKPYRTYCSLKKQVRLCDFYVAMCLCGSNQPFGVGSNI